MDMPRPTLSAAGRAAWIAVGLCFVVAEAVGQEVEFDRLWSHDTGG